MSNIFHVGGPQFRDLETIRTDHTMYLTLTDTNEPDAYITTQEGLYVRVAVQIQSEDEFDLLEIFWGDGRHEMMDLEGGGKEGTQVDHLYELSGSYIIRARLRNLTTGTFTRLAPTVRADVS